MSMHQVKDEILHVDVRQERIAAGTVSGNHVQPSTLTGAQTSSTITVYDSRVTYSGGGWLKAPVGLNPTFDIGGEAITQIGFNGAAGDYASVNFTGSSVAILGYTQNFGGKADVFIEEVLAQGRLTTRALLGLSGNFFTAPTLSATATSIYAVTNGFAASGTIVIDDEVIPYTSLNGDGLHFDGCTRQGTKLHSNGTNIYQYDSTVDFYTPDNTSDIVWSNNLLSPGAHTLKIVLRSDKNAASTDYYMKLGGFLLGGVMGAANISVSTTTVAQSGVTFDASGLSTSAIPISSWRGDQRIIGMLGAAAYSGASLRPCFASFDGIGYTLYCPTGASQTLDVKLTFSLLGRTL